MGDHFNNIAVMSLAMQHANAGLVVTGVFLARAVPMLAAGPIAGVLLDRLDRKRVMIASDVTRAVIALRSSFHSSKRSALLYLLSAALMFASPFFTAGRNSILPGIATREELHTANTMTQTTSWASLTIGAFLGAVGAQFGFVVAFAFNALSFVISALCISQLKRAGGFGPRADSAQEERSGRRAISRGSAYMRATPLVFGIAMLSVGWASGGGAAQILFSLFGEKVFQRGADGDRHHLGVRGHRTADRRDDRVLAGQTPHACAIQANDRDCLCDPRRSLRAVQPDADHGAGACVFIVISRAAIAVSSVLNTSSCCIMWRIGFADVCSRRLNRSHGRR